MINIERRVALGEFDLEEMDLLPDEELFDKLKSFAGVGDKVANCVALFAYHRCGRAPVDTGRDVALFVGTAFKL